ncbi:Flavodoxin/ferredoxin--NADP reductase [Methylophilaceae bacterium]|nr:Flavodoxin/ferredoxin--NADP reductase [Methylophilaceae bacterium]
MAAWNNGTVVAHKQWSPTLHSLYVESAIEPYKAGQFVKIGLEIDGRIVGRPYSLCNAPEARPLEFYYIEVPDGELTSRLVKLQPGDSLLVAPHANGFMILDEVPPARHLWLMATGTGVGPFLSILDTAEPWQRFERVVLVYAVRTLSELSYRQRIAEVQQKHGGQFVFVPFTSREMVDFAIHGRIPQAIADGRLERAAEINMTADDSQIMLCGNPQMIEDTMQTLTERGLRKHRRKEPGQITVEHYW